MFNLVLNWGKEAHLFGYKFEPTQLHQKTQTEYLERYEGLNIIKPYQISIKLDFKPSIIVPVPVYDFTQQLLSLLSDESLFGNLSNLDVNKENCFDKFKSHNNLLNCVNSGSWYENAHSYHCKDNNDFY